MFAIDSVDNPVKELFLTGTVFTQFFFFFFFFFFFTQFEKTYLAFLNILAKCDFWEKMTLGPCRLIFGIFKFKPTKNLLSTTDHDFA